MDHLEEEKEIKVIEADKSKINKLLKVTAILAVVTFIEYAIAFLVPFTFHYLKVTLFILLTFVKVYYIVAEFMHLKHEVKTLINSIVIPAIFICWLILALLIEGGYIIVH